MFSLQKNSCSLLAVLCGEGSDYKHKQDRPRYPFPELVSSGRLEVQTLSNPKIDEFQQVLESLQPNIVYLQGEQRQNEEIGSLVWNGIDLTTNEKICALFGDVLPAVVYLELPNGEKLAEALHRKGVPYVIHWRSSLSCYGACHFRHSLFSVIQSSCSHTWDAFQLAHASFTLHCVRNNHGVPAYRQTITADMGPHLLGNPPTAIVSPIKKHVDEEDYDELSNTAPAIRIHDDDLNMKFLLCGTPRALDACLLGSVEDGLNALLNIEIRGSKLRSRVSAPPPPLQAGSFSRGVVTMRCDLSTSSSTYISLLVSGSAETCFDDQLLEDHIKNELLERSRLVQALPSSSDETSGSSAPRTSVAIACGSSVYEVCVKIPTWASQVLRQLAPENLYRSFVSLGIASIQGYPVASFEKDDADRFLFFCTTESTDLENANPNPNHNSPPSWLTPPTPCRKRSFCGDNGNEIRKKVKVAAMRPIPHITRHRMLPFQRAYDPDGYYDGSQEANVLPAPPPPPKQKRPGPAPGTQRKSQPISNRALELVYLNPLPRKRHECDRSPIQNCSEFLRDLMQFLLSRGYNRLVPQGGLAEFPDAILNAKRLDLYNLYREVVSRGGFRVGNGINWKGQIFSKMRNHTATNKMTGVGNALKKHYETYLLEYELAHEDVDGECCLLCHSSAPGDWVNCGVCGEWAHFGCDRRQGLGAFKDYAKTDGLEYICPHCSITSFSRKPQKSMNDYSRASNGLRAM
ncbi:hypothetical protein ACHQM5_029587 [Ranunculus cassubicifolius]